ncbi:NAD(P)-binding protein [Polyplosphaeria fusca]|uniref:NAD(P)-binding protein n=1 Tax=Polyplosphaeria fusca TaxID=682080 RepID=A0A9P4VAB4_9PLEO|nr:NAD(P)-binding protein [Polyplosphaeria fusca]
MFTVLITGASSGLGLAFLKHYASQPSTRVIALDTSPMSADTATAFPDMQFHQADVTSPALLMLCQTLEVQSISIDLLIHSAGIRGLVSEVVQEKRGDVNAAETYETMNRETMMRTLEINTWGTFNVVKTFLPRLKSASSPSEPAKVVIMSSRMGSMSSNVGGAGYAYRASKAGLNAVVKSFSIDVPEVAFLLLHPGRVETGLVEWKEEGAMSLEESLRDCLKVINGLEKADSGGFVDRFGETIGW